MIDQLDTADALRLVGVDLKSWRNTVDRGFYLEAPKPQRGRRSFRRDDCVALAVFKTLTGLGVKTNLAARLASDVRAAMRGNEEIETLYIQVVSDADGSSRADVVSTPAPGNLFLLPLFIGKWRADWAAQIRALIAERDSAQ